MSLQPCLPCVSDVAGFELFFSILRLLSAQLFEPSVLLAFEALSVQGEICI